jgi:hypothetical protein
MTNIEFDEIIHDRLCCIEELTNLLDEELESIMCVSDKITCLLSTIENIAKGSNC